MSLSIIGPRPINVQAVLAALYSMKQDDTANFLPIKLGAGNETTGSKVFVKYPDESKGGGNPQIVIMREDSSCTVDLNAEGLTFDYAGRWNDPTRKEPNLNWLLWLMLTVDKDGRPKALLKHDFDNIWFVVSQSTANGLPTEELKYDHASTDRNLVAAQQQDFEKRLKPHVLAFYKAIGSLGT